MTRLILASASPARTALLKGAGLTFDAIPADLDESRIKQAGQTAGHPPSRIAADLAIAKAKAIGAAYPAALVLGADQVLVHRNRLLSKPRDRTDARDQLASLRGDTHQLISAAALVAGGTVRWQTASTAHLTMRPFTDAFLDSYLETAGDLVLGSVGCYHLEGLGAQLFASIDGDYFTVLGLPLLPVLAALRAEGHLPE